MAADVGKGIGAAEKAPAQNLAQHRGRSSFCTESSRHCPCQTIRARELKFGENVHPLSCVTCQVSSVTFFFLLLFSSFYKVMELVGGGSVINGAYPV